MTTIASPPRRTAAERNPGDPDPRTVVERTIRVDQAGEYGATRIYAGQLAVMGARHPEAREIARMAAQEERHRARFDAMMTERRVRPTALTPLWNVAGFALYLAYGRSRSLAGRERAVAEA